MLPKAGVRVLEGDPAVLALADERTGAVTPSGVAEGVPGRARPLIRADGRLVGGPPAVASDVAEPAAWGPVNRAGEDSAAAIGARSPDAGLSLPAGPETVVRGGQVLAVASGPRRRVQEVLVAAPTLG